MTCSVSHVPCTSAVLVQEIFKACRVSHVPCTSTVLVQEILKRAAFHTLIVVLGSAALLITSCLTC